MAPDPRQYPGFESSRPYVRWTWLNGPFRPEDIRYQLDWLNASGFGGVEVAWIDPAWQSGQGDPLRPAWLSQDWTELVAFAKAYADSLGLGCDFSFGSGTPVGGGSQVSLEHAAQTLDGPSPQRVTNSWEPGRWLIADRLSEDALRAYAAPLAPALAPALVGSLSALTCEVQGLDAAELWTTSLWDAFEARYGYRLEGRLELAKTHPHMRYEYRRMVGSAMQREFFDTYARICREFGAISRVQCHGAPVDLLAACATV
ncbi:MAG: glycosyl hydrolase, partial [Chloroflexota bacterium]